MTGGGLDDRRRRAPASESVASDEFALARRTYRRAALDVTTLHEGEREDPLLAVRRWVGEALDAGTEPEPTAMTLATVESRPTGAVGGVDAVPDARVVLCKGMDHGLLFYTSRVSAKAAQLAATPAAAAVLLWMTLERQVRVRGLVEVVDDDTSDAYFATRPRGSQLSAWTSRQSQPVADRATLEARVEQVAARFDGEVVPRPEHWGGYRLVPTTVELWQGRPDRLHDRLRWRRSDGEQWILERLQP